MKDLDYKCRWEKIPMIKASMSIPLSKLTEDEIGCTAMDVLNFVKDQTEGNIIANLVKEDDGILKLVCDQKKGSPYDVMTNEDNDSIIVLVYVKVERLLAKINENGIDYIINLESQ